VSVGRRLTVTLERKQKGILLPGAMQLFLRALLVGLNPTCKEKGKNLTFLQLLTALHCHFCLPLKWKLP